MEDRLQKLPADVREAMMKASEEIIAAVAKYLDGQVTQNVSSFEKQGMQINRVSKDEWHAGRERSSPSRAMDQANGGKGLAR